MELSYLIYDITKGFPIEERFALTTQMRKCAVSIPSNISEGKMRGTRKDYARFVSIAFGSGAELETQTEIARYAQYISDEEYREILNLLTEVMKMLNKLRSSLG